jgi:hypothetical protein
LENSIYEKDFNPKKYAGAYIPPMYAAPDRREVDNDDGLLCQRIDNLLNDNRKID